MEVWTAAVFTVLTIALFALAGALWVAIRGAGRTTGAIQDILILKTATEQLDERLTREVKQRAGHARAAQAEEERSIAQQAQTILAEQGNSAPPAARPSRLRGRNH